MKAVCRHGTGYDVEADRNVAAACAGILLVPVYLFKLHEHRRRFKGCSAAKEVYLIIP